MSMRRAARIESCRAGSPARVAPGCCRPSKMSASASPPSIYQVARFHFAPNQELIDKLHGATHKPCSLMERGVDLAHVQSRVTATAATDGQFVIGYVGRLSTEKKVRSFAELSRAVKAAGYNHVKFVFVGHGVEEPWLRQHIPDAEMTGVLRGAGARPCLRQHGSVCLLTRRLTPSATLFWKHWPPASPPWSPIKAVPSSSSSTNATASSVPLMRSLRPMYCA